MSSWHLSLLELPQYFLVACCALAVDTGILLLLSGHFHLPYLLAASCSFLLGGVVGYQLCTRFVWKSDPTASKSYQATLFTLLGVVGLGINAVVMFGMVSGLHTPVLIGKGISAGCTFLCNYWLRRRWVFGRATRRIVSWLPQRAGE
ncbi:MAG TPA: GtrA family protein [Steroidobacteraceae bacterium]|jgi:putative flippase GtrA|nr:GtrA family protein [Steroidobacteraceae bacterium]